jgi:hypothetical protein
MTNGKKKKSSGRKKPLPKASLHRILHHTPWPPDPGSLLFTKHSTIATALTLSHRTPRRKPPGTPPEKLRATEAVLNTSELLENILIHLPTRDLCVVQCVSHQFRDATSNSPAIRREMVSGEAEARRAAEETRDRCYRTLNLVRFNRLGNVWRRGRDLTKVL